MNEATAKRLILVTALETEIQGMIAENKQRELNGESLAYDNKLFFYIADQMREIANAHDDQVLFNMG